MVFKSRIRRIIYCIWFLSLYLYMVLKEFDKEYDLGFLYIKKNGLPANFFSIRLLLITVVILGCCCFFCLTSYVIEKLDVRIYINGSCSKKIMEIIGMSFLLFILGGEAALVFDIANNYQRQVEVDSIRKLLLSQKAVVHAFGSIDYGGDTYAYTNSYEAMENCYSSGNKIAEADFMMTSDGVLVCAHDGNEGSWANGIEGTEPLTETDFLSRRIYNSFTTMGMEQVAEFIRQHTDFYVVTDIKDDNYEACAYIADHYPDIRDNIIVQIYSIGEYNEILSLGFKNMIFTLYRTEKGDRDPQVLIENIKEFDLCAITFWYYYVDDAYFWDGMMNSGIPMFVHTVNDRDDIISYLDNGLLVYTDNTDNEWMR